jgi:hypothetical protein
MTSGKDATRNANFPNCIRHYKFMALSICICARVKLEPLLHRPIVSNATKGCAMITMGIGVAAGIFYWLAWYKLAFWILIYRSPGTSAGWPAIFKIVARMG